MIIVLSIETPEIYLCARFNACQFKRNLVIVVIVLKRTHSQSTNENVRIKVNDSFGDEFSNVRNEVV